MFKFFSRLSIMSSAMAACIGLVSTQADAAVVWQSCTITNVGQFSGGTHVKCVEKLGSTNVTEYYVPLSSSADADRFLQVALAAKLAGKVLQLQADTSTPTSGMCSGSTTCRVPTGWYFN